MFNFIQVYNFQKDMSEKSWTDANTSKSNHCLVYRTDNEDGIHHFLKGDFCVRCFLVKALLKPFHAFPKLLHVFVNFKQIGTDRPIPFPIFLKKYEEKGQLRHLLFTFAVAFKTITSIKMYLLST